MRLILKYCTKAIRLFPVQFITSMIMIMLMTVMNSITPWGLRIYIAEVTKSNQLSTLGIGLLIFTIYYGLCIGIKIAWYVALDQFGGKYINYLTLELQEKMATTFYSEIERVQPNVIRNILYTDVLNVFRVVGHHLPSLLNAIAIMIVALVLAAMLNLKITVLIAVAATVGLLLSWISRNVLAKTAGATNSKLKIHDAWCTHFVQMLPTLHTHNILSYFQKQSSENIAQFITTSIQEDKRTLFWSELISSYHGLFSVALSALLVMPLVQKSIADLVFYTMISTLVMTQAQRAEVLFQQIIKSYISFKHIDDLNQVTCRKGMQKVTSINTIKFNSVDFSYTNGVHALKQVTCTLNRGDVIHLQGQNGSGKSTFIKLLTGMYEPSSGTLHFNGSNSLNLSQTSRNDEILYIGQDDQYLNENFKTYLEVLSGKSLSVDHYNRLLMFVGLPNDERKISGNGQSLSVGQRKKLLFIQMLLRSEAASVIILDEITAGLDAETTRKVSDYIAELANQKNKIIIVVDHAVASDIPVTRKMKFNEGYLTEA